MDEISDLKNKIEELNNLLKIQENRYTTNTKILNEELDELKNEVESLKKENKKLKEEAKKRGSKRNENDLKKKDEIEGGNKGIENKSKRIFKDDKEATILIQSFIRMKLSRNIVKTIKKRRRIVKEIFDSEKTYFELLKTATIIYQKELRETEGTKLGLTEKQIATIFGNIENLSLFHIDLVKKMSKIVDRWDESSLMADVLNKFFTTENVISAYIYYVNKYEDSVALVHHLNLNNKAWVKYMDEKRENALSKGLRLDSLLVTPVQRFPRYTLLMSELLKQISIKEKTYRIVENVINLTRSVVEKIEESKMESDLFKELRKLNDQVDFSKEKHIEGAEPTQTLIKKERRLVHQIDCQFEGNSCCLWIFSDSVSCLTKNDNNTKKFCHLWNVNLLDSHLEKNHMDNSIVLVTNKRINKFPFTTIFSHNFSCEEKFNYLFWSSMMADLNKISKKNQNAYISNISVSDHLIQNMISNTDWRILRTACKEMTFQSGIALSFEEDYNLFYLKKGTLKCQRNIDGSYYKIGKVKENNFFGEFLFLNKEIYERYETLTEVSIECFDKKKLYQLLGCNKDLSEKLFILICSKIARRFYTVKKKYEEDIIAVNTPRNPPNTLRRRASNYNFKICESIGIGFNELVKEIDCLYRKSNISKLKGQFLLFKSLCAFSSKIFGRKTKFIIPFSSIDHITPQSQTLFCITTKTKVQYIFELNEENKNDLLLIINQYENMWRSKTKSDEIEKIDTNNEFFKISDTDWENIFSICSTKFICHNNKVIMKQGDYFQRLYFIVQGSCKVQRNPEDENTEPKILSVLSKNDFFGDLTFLFGGAANANVFSHINTEKNEKLELYIFEKEKLEYLFSFFPLLGPKFYFHLAYKLSKRWMNYLDNILTEN